MRPLSPRQISILRLVILGWQGKYIAHELGLAVGTIKVYLNVISGRLPKQVDQRVGKRASMMLYLLHHPEILNGGKADDAGRHE